MLLTPVKLIQAKYYLQFYCFVSLAFFSVLQDLSLFYATFVYCSCKTHLTGHLDQIFLGFVETQFRKNE